MYCIRRAAQWQTSERFCETSVANFQSALLNRGQQILLPSFSASGSLGHETIDPLCPGKTEICDTRVSHTTSHSAARRSATRYRPRHLASSVLISTVSLTVNALRQGTEYTDVRSR